MQIIVTLEPIEIVLDLTEQNWATAGLTASELAHAAHTGIRTAIEQIDPDWDLSITVRPYIPPTTGVISVEINPF